MKLKEWFKNLGRLVADWKNTLLFIMVVFYPLMVIPAKGQYFEGYYDYFLAPRYAVLAVVAIFGLVVLVLENEVYKDRVFIPLLAFLGFGLTAAVLAAHPLTAWIGAPMRFTGFSTYIFVFILFMLAIRLNCPEKILPGMVGVTGFISILAVLQVFGLNLVPHEAFRAGVTAYGTLGNPDNYGTYAAFVLPAAIYLYLARSHYLWLAAVGLIYGGLLMSFTWGAWIGFVFGLGYLVWRFNNQENKKQWLYIAGVMVCITLTFAVGEMLLGFKDRVGMVSLVQQVKLWGSTLELFTHSWAFGLGPDHLVHVVKMLPLSNLAAKAPNMYLEMAVTMGSFALLAYLFLIIYILRQAKDELGAMIIVYLVQGIFHYEGLHLLPLFWIVLGLSFARSRKKLFTKAYL